jgi:hypothetical protein
MTADRPEDSWTFAIQPGALQDLSLYPSGQAGIDAVCR